MLRTHQARSDLRATLVARSSGTAIWTNTKEASPLAMLVPMPMLVFDLNSAGSMTLARSAPLQRAIPKSSEDPLPAPASDKGTRAMPLVEEPPREQVKDLAQASEASEPPDAAEPEFQQSAERPDISSELPTAAEPEPQSSSETHRIELIIDSLPHLQLIESIPVTVESLGDQVFTATVHALNLTGTGNTLGDALIIVKEQIEILHDKLLKTTDPDTDEKEYLTYLQSHIKITPSDNPRHAKRSLWR